MILLGYSILSYFFESTSLQDDGVLFFLSRLLFIESAMATFLNNGLTNFNIFNIFEMKFCLSIYNFHYMSSSANRIASSTSFLFRAVVTAFSITDMLPSF